MVDSLFYFFFSKLLDLYYEPQVMIVLNDFFKRNSDSLYQKKPHMKNALFCSCVREFLFSTDFLFKISMCQNFSFFFYFQPIFCLFMLFFLVLVTFPLFCEMSSHTLILPILTKLVVMSKSGNVLWCRLW